MTSDKSNYLVWNQSRDEALLLAVKDGARNPYEIKKKITDYAAFRDVAPSAITAPKIRKRCVILMNAISKGKAPKGVRAKIVSRLGDIVTSNVRSGRPKKEKTISRPYYWP